MNFQPLSNASVGSDAFARAFNKLESNLSELSKIKENFPSRYQNLSDSEARTKAIFQSFHTEMEEIVSRSCQLDVEINENERNPQVLKVLMSKRKGVEKSIEKVLKVSVQVLTEFQKLEKNLPSIVENISNLEKNQPLPHTQNRKVRGKPFIIVKDGNLENAKSEFENTVYSTLKIVEEMVKFHPVPKQKEIVGLPVEMIQLIPKHLLRNDERFANDVTGLAEFLYVSSRFDAYDVAKRHMQKRIYLIRLVFEGVKYYSEGIRNAGYKIHDEVSAMKVYQSSESSFPKYYEEAHISLSPQIQLISESMKTSNNRVRILNPKNVPLKLYFAWTSGASVSLNEVLNTTDRVPEYINLIDNISETHDRDCLFFCLNKTVIDERFINEGFQIVLEKIYNTLISLEEFLKSGNRTFTKNIIPTTETTLVVRYSYEDSDLPIRIDNAIAGMINALNDYISREGNLPVLKK